jgi:hypothetical protein
MKFPFLFTKEIADPFVQGNFSRLSAFFKADPITKCELSFFEITETGAVTDKDFPHNLGYEPKDIILLHNLNNVALTWVYTAFNATNIRYTLGGATTLRFLLGRYAE